MVSGVYSTSVIERAIERYESKAQHRLTRIDPSRTDAWVAHLDARLAKQERDHPGEGEKYFWESASREEKLFIRNERVLSYIDFRYWAERYATIQKDGGGICKLIPWESQRIILDKMATREAEMHDRRDRDETVDGILIVGHKARQLGETALGRCVCTHRITTQHHRRAMSASVDDDKIQEMYDRDKLIYDSLPWWMKPALRYDEKAAHVYFESLDSRVLYQVSSQKSGMGVSRQFDIGHLTELSTWINAAAVELDFFPTLPMSLSTFCLLESTAFGRGNWWHDFSERARHGYTARFIYVFIPWYAEVTKYHRTPPVTWIPSEVALKHASRVHETSPEFMGREVLLTRDQLYWWESTRADYMKGNNLTFFLTNYCATPEESFQHSGQSAFDPLLLDSLRGGVQKGVPYELRG